MIADGEPVKKRQKLMRNLRIVELLVNLLKSPFHGVDQYHMTKIFVAAYHVLYAYLMGNSRKNELYIAKYIDFFLTQFEIKEVIYLFYIPLRAVPELILVARGGGGEGGEGVGKAERMSYVLPKYMSIDFLTQFEIKELIWATSWENLFVPYANNKDAKEMFISTFVVHCLNSIIPILAKSIISRP